MRHPYKRRTHDLTNDYIKPFVKHQRAFVVLRDTTNYIVIEVKVNQVSCSKNKVPVFMKS